MVDPKRDMIQTPIDDDDDLGSGSGSIDASRAEARVKARVIHPPGIQSGADDYKKTRGYIMIAYKTMEYMYSREFLSSWKTWTGVRYICMQMPRQLGLRRIAFYRQLSCTSDFSYVLLIEVTNLLLYAAQTLNLMDRIKLRLCGCAGVFRETDFQVMFSCPLAVLESMTMMSFQVDPVTANIHHISTNYRPPEKPNPAAITTTLGRLDSVDSLGSLAQPSRKSSQAQLTNGTSAANGDASANVDMLMQLLKQQQEAAARRKAAMERPAKGKKRHSLAPPDYPAPSVPETATTTSGDAAVTEQQKTETSKKAPTAQPESEDSDAANSSPTVDPASQKAPKMHAAEKRVLHQQQTAPYGMPTQHQMLQQQQPPPQQLLHPPQMPVFHSTAPLYPIEISTALSTPIPQAHPYFAQYHEAETLTVPQGPYSNVFGQILTQPIDAIMQNRQPMQEMVINDYRPVYTYTGKPVMTSAFGYVQPTGPETPPEFCYNSPVYSRTEWKQASAAYAGHAAEESIRNLAEQFRTLRETPIIGSDPYLLSSTSGTDAEMPMRGYPGRGYRYEDGDNVGYLDGTMHRERSHSAAFEEDPRKAYMRRHGRNHTLLALVEQERPKHRKMAQSDQLQQKVQEAERLQKKIVETGKIVDVKELQQKIAEAENLQQKIAEAERLQQKIAEAERIQQKLAIAERIQQQHMAAETAERLKQNNVPIIEDKTVPRVHRDRGDKAPHRQKSAPRLDEIPAAKQSPPSSPKRRTLPRIPPQERPVSDEEMEVEPKRHHEKRAPPPVPHKPSQHQAGQRVDNKEPVEAEHRPRRPRDGANAEKQQKQKEQPEKSQHPPHDQAQRQSELKQEQPNGDGTLKGRKVSPVSRSRRHENGAETKSRQASTSANGRNPKSPPEATAAAPTAETNGRHEKSRSRDANGNRSRSRDDTVQKNQSSKPSTSAIDGPSTSTAGQQKPKVAESSTAAGPSTSGEQSKPKSGSASKGRTSPTKSSRQSPSKGRQSPKKRKQ